MSANEPVNDRVRFVEHKGKTILVIDFTNSSGKEALKLLDAIQETITDQERGSVLALADFTGANIDKAVARRAQEVLVLDRPFVKKSAWVGTDSLPKVFYEHFKNFSQRELPAFKTREEAMDWLVRE